MSWVPSDEGMKVVVLVKLEKGGKLASATNGLNTNTSGTCELSTHGKVDHVVSAYMRKVVVVEVGPLGTCRP